MPRVSRTVRDIAEKNRGTMEKTTLFELWVVRFLKNRDRLEEYRKAYDLVNGGGDDSQQSDT